jgi:hypothetical protein
MKGVMWVRSDIRGDIRGDSDKDKESDDKNLLLFGFSGAMCYAVNICTTPI